MSCSRAAGWQARTHRLLDVLLLLLLLLLLRQRLSALQITSAGGGGGGLLLGCGLGGQLLGLCPGGLLRQAEAPGPVEGVYGALALPELPLLCRLRRVVERSRLSIRTKSLPWQCKNVRRGV